MGNQTAYDVFGFAATFVAGSMIPIGSTVNIARSAGTSVTKAVIMGTGQSAVTAAAGYAGSKLGANLGYTISKDWFGADERTAQNISNATGLVGAVAAAAGAYKVTGNIVNKALQPKPSNTHSKFGAEAAEKASGLKKPIQTIKNRYPNEVQQGKTFDHVIENGQIKIRDGIHEADFIIDMEGNLKVGSGHSHLADGADVQAAGKLKLDKSGNVRRIDNQSGHYTPTVDHANNYQQIFENSGINTQNAWLENYSLNITESGYVDLGKLSYTSTQLK